MDGMRREWRPDWPVPIGQVWAHWRRGSSDPTYRVDEAGRHWRALGTPTGAATLRVLARPTLGVIEADAWGAGASWALAHLPAMLGADDDPSGMPLLHEAVRRAAHQHPHWRVGRGGIVWDVLVPAIIEQKVTGQEASAGLFRLVRRYGTPAPGPGGAAGLRVLPDAASVRGVPSWEWLKLGIDGGRSSTLVRSARVAESLQRVAALPGPDDAGFTQPPCQQERDEQDGEDAEPDQQRPRIARRDRRVEDRADDDGDKRLRDLVPDEADDGEGEQEAPTGEHAAEGGEARRTRHVRNIRQGPRIGIGDRVSRYVEFQTS